MKFNHTNKMQCHIVIPSDGRTYNRIWMEIPKCINCCCSFTNEKIWLNEMPFTIYTCLLTISVMFPPPFDRKRCIQCARVPVSSTNSCNVRIAINSASQNQCPQRTHIFSIPCPVISYQSGWRFIWKIFIYEIVHFDRCSSQFNI